MLIAILLGFAFGFFGSIPVAGPISLLVLDRGLQQRFQSGLALAAGAALAEAAYAFLAFWGTNALLAEHPALQHAARILGALLFIGLGVMFCLRKSEPTVPPRALGRRSSFVLGFTITALNPTFLATWTGAVTALHATGAMPVSTAPAVPFAVAAGAGIVAWFTLFLAILRAYRHRLRPSVVVPLLQVIGVLLVLAGVWFGIEAVREWCSTG